MKFRKIASDEVIYVATSPVRITLKLDEIDIYDKLNIYEYIDSDEEGFEESEDDFIGNIESSRKDYEEWATLYTDSVCDYSQVHNDLKNVDLAEYLDGDLKSIVNSITIRLDEEESIAYTTIKCDRELTKSELDELRDNITGQFSDGWGESFEQQDFDAHGETVGFHFDFMLPNGEYQKIREDIDIESFNVHFWHKEFKFDIVKQ